MNNQFEHKEAFMNEKKLILSRADLSKKGSIDIEIKELVDAINAHDDFCTTSSCAGRITLLERRSSRKIDAKWLFTSHQPVTFDALHTALVSDADVWLMQESCILHVFARTLDAADAFLALCRKAGFKRTGITSLSKKIMIEIMGNEKVEALIIKEGKRLISDENLKVLVNECNGRMQKNRLRMNTLLNEVTSYSN